MKKEIIAIIAGIFLICASIILPVVPLVLLIVEKSSEKFLVPGSIEVNVEKEGKYYLWSNYRTLYNGRTYSTGKEVPGGLTISLQDIGGAKTYDIIPSSSMSSSGGAEDKQTVGYYELKKGRYLLKVEGEMEPRVFSFGYSLASTWAILFGVGFVLSFLLVPLGGLMVVIAVIFIVKKAIEKSSK